MRLLCGCLGVKKREESERIGKSEARKGWNGFFCIFLESATGSTNCSKGGRCQLGASSPRPRSCVPKSRTRTRLSPHCVCSSPEERWSPQFAPLVSLSSLFPFDGGSLQFSLALSLQSQRSASTFSCHFSANWLVALLGLWPKQRNDSFGGTHLVNERGREKAQRRFSPLGAFFLVEEKTESVRMRVFFSTPCFFLFFHFFPLFPPLVFDKRLGSKK